MPKILKKNKKPGQYVYVIGLSKALGQILDHISIVELAAKLSCSSGTLYRWYCPPETYVTNKGFETLRVHSDLLDRFSKEYKNIMNKDCKVKPFTLM